MMMHCTPTKLSMGSQPVVLHRRGTVLIIVLIAMMLLALSAYAFTNLMLDHRKSAEAVSMRSQSDASVASAADQIRAFLMQTPSQQLDNGGVYDNPAFFSFQPVVSDPSPQFSSQFSVLSTELGDSNEPSATRFGMIDESSKINLNELVANEEDASESTLALLVLPGMTADIADSILDWIDEDIEQREYGIEDYSGVEPPRTPSDGPIHSLSELLLVQGVTSQMLYGMDTNRNGQVEPEEAQLAAGMESLTGTAGDDVVTASMELGWSAYLTVYGRERNIDPNGNYRINLNMENLEELHARITDISDEDTATFIVAYRQFGPIEIEEEEEEEQQGGEQAGGQAGGQQGGAQQGPGGEQPPEEEEEEIVTESVDGRTVDLTVPAEFEFDSEADLFDAVVEVEFASETEGEAGEPVLVLSPFAVGDTQVLGILPYLSVTDERAIAGRINVNQASRPVLSTIRDLETEAIDQIIASQQQRNATQFGRAHPIWLVYDEIIDIETMREIMPLLTAGGDVYSADIVASSGDGNAVRRVRVVLDATRPEVPQLVWKDKEFLGRGFPREVLIDPSTVQSNTSSF